MSGAETTFFLNGHYYLVVNSAVTWQEARDLAAASIYNGLQGYLATVTSLQEQSFLYNLARTQVNAGLGGASIWIGASDRDIEGQWRWSTGPEAGTLFWVGGSAWQATNSNYSNWATIPTVASNATLTVGMTVGAEIAALSINAAGVNGALTLFAPSYTGAGVGSIEITGAPVHTNTITVPGESRSSISVTGGTAKDTVVVNKPFENDGHSLTILANLGAGKDVVTLQISDIPQEASSGSSPNTRYVTLHAQATGEDNSLRFVFEDSADTLVLSAASVIDGFARMEVSGGTVDVTEVAAITFPGEIMILSAEPGGDSVPTPAAEITLTLNEAYVGENAWRPDSEADYGLISLTTDPSNGLGQWLQGTESMLSAYVIEYGGLENVSVSAPSTPPQTLMTGKVYHWKSGALLSGVDVDAASIVGSVGEGKLFELRSGAMVGAELRTELWVNLGSAVVENLSVELGFGSNPSVVFALNSGITSWSLLSGQTTSGSIKTLSIGGFAGSLSSALTGSVKLGDITASYGEGQMPVDVGFLFGEAGDNRLSPYGIQFGLYRDTTDGAGGYEMGPMPVGLYKVGASRALTAGETGNVISSADALAALKIAVGRNPNSDNGVVSPYQFISADVNEDGRITSADALAILKMAVKRSDAPEREWIFIDEQQDFWNEATNTFTTTRTSVPKPAEFAVTVDAATRAGLNLVAMLKGDVNGSWAPPSGTPPSHQPLPGSTQANGLAPIAMISANFAPLLAPSVSAAAPLVSFSTLGGSTTFLAAKTATDADFSNQEWNSLISAYGNATAGNDLIALSTVVIATSFAAAVKAAGAASGDLVGTLVNGGAGTDALVLRLSAGITATTVGDRSSNVFTQNVEVVVVEATANVTVDTKNFDGVLELWNSDSTGNVSFTNVSSTNTVVVVEDTAASTSVAFAEGAEDGTTVTVVLDEVTGGTLNIDTSNLEDFSGATLRISSNGSLAANTLTGITETGSNIDTLSLFGSKGMTLSGIALGIDTLNASGLTGNLVLTMGTLGATNYDVIAGAGAANRVNATVSGDAALELTRVQTLAITQATAGTVNLDGSTGLSTVTLTGTAVGAASFKNVQAGVNFSTAGTTTTSVTSIAFKDLGDLNFSASGATTLTGLTTDNARVINLSSSAATGTVAFGAVTLSEEARAVNLSNSAAGAVTATSITGAGTEALIINATTSSTGATTVTGSVIGVGNVYGSFAATKGAVSVSSGADIRSEQGLVALNLNAVSADVTTGAAIADKDLSVVAVARGDTTTGSTSNGFDVTVGNLTSNTGNAILDLTATASSATGANAATIGVGTVTATTGQASIAATVGTNGTLTIGNTFSRGDAFVNVSTDAGSTTTIGSVASTGTETTIGTTGAVTLGAVSGKAVDLAINASRGTTTIGGVTASTGNVVAASTDFGSVSTGNSGVVTTNVGANATLNFGGLTATVGTVTVGTDAAAIAVASGGTLTTGAITAAGDISLAAKLATTASAGSGAGNAITSNAGSVSISATGAAAGSDFVAGNIRARGEVAIDFEGGAITGTNTSSFTSGTITSDDSSVALDLSVGRGGQVIVAAGGITARTWTGETAVDIKLDVGTGSVVNSTGVAAGAGFAITATHGDVVIDATINSDPGADASTVRFSGVTAASGGVTIDGDSSLGAAGSWNLGAINAWGAVNLGTLETASNGIALGESSALTIASITSTKDVSAYLEQQRNAAVVVSGATTSTDGSVTIVATSGANGAALTLGAVAALVNIDLDFTGGASSSVNTGNLTTQSDGAKVLLDLAVGGRAAVAGGSEITVGTITANDTGATVTANLSAGNLSDIAVGAGSADGNVSYTITTGQGTTNTVGATTSVAGDITVVTTVNSSATGLSTLTFTSLTAGGPGGDVTAGTSTSKLLVNGGGILTLGSVTANQNVAVYADLSSGVPPGQNTVLRATTLTATNGSVTVNTLLGTNTDVQLDITGNISAATLVDIDFVGGFDSVARVGTLATPATVTATAGSIDIDILVGGSTSAAANAIEAGNLSAVASGGKVDLSVSAGALSKISVGTATADYGVTVDVSTGQGTNGASANTIGNLQSNRTGVLLRGSVNSAAGSASDLTIGTMTAMSASGTIAVGSSTNGFAVGTAGTLTIGATKATNNVDVYVNQSGTSTVATAAASTIESVNGAVTIQSTGGANGARLDLNGNAGGVLASGEIDIDFKGGVGGRFELSTVTLQALRSSTGSVKADVSVGSESSAGAGEITISGGDITALGAGPLADESGRVIINATAGDGAIIRIAAAENITADANVTLNITTGKSSQAVNTVGGGTITSNNGNVDITALVRSSEPTAARSSLTFGALTATQGDVVVQSSSAVQERGVLTLGAVTANGAGGEFRVGSVENATPVGVTIGANGQLVMNGAISTRSDIAVVARLDVGSTVDFTNTVNSAEGRVTINVLGSSFAPANAELLFGKGDTIVAGEGIDIDFVVGAGGRVTLDALTSGTSNVDLNLAVGNRAAGGNGGIYQAGNITATNTGSSVVIRSAAGFDADTTIAGVAGAANNITAGRDVIIDMTTGIATTNLLAAAATAFGTITAYDGSIIIDATVNSENGNASTLRIGNLRAIEGNGIVSTSGNVSFTTTSIGASGSITVGTLTATGTGNTLGSNVFIGTTSTDRVVLAEQATFTTGAVTAERNVAAYFTQEADSDVSLANAANIIANNGLVTISALGSKADATLTVGNVRSEGNTTIRFEGGFDSKATIGTIRALSGNLDLDLIVGSEDSAAANQTNITVGKIEATGSGATVDIVASADTGSLVSIASGTSIVADSNITFDITVGEGLATNVAAESVIATTVISNQGDIKATTRVSSSNSSADLTSNSTVTYGTLTTYDGNVRIHGESFIGVQGNLVLGNIVAGSATTQDTTKGNILIGAGSGRTLTNDAAVIVAIDAVNVQFGGTGGARTSLLQTGTLTASQNIEICVDLETGASLTTGTVTSTLGDITIAVTSDAARLAGETAGGSVITTGTMTANNGVAALSLDTSATVVNSPTLSIGAISADRIVVHYTGSGAGGAFTQGGNVGAFTANQSVRAGTGTGGDNLENGRTNDAVYYRLRGSAPVDLAAPTVLTGSTTFINARGLTGGLTAVGSAAGTNTFIVDGGTNSLTGGTTWSDTFAIRGGTANTITNLSAAIGSTNSDVLQVSNGASVTAVVDTSFRATGGSKIAGSVTFTLAADILDLRPLSGADFTGTAVVNAGGGDDTVSVGAGTSTINSSAGADTIRIEGGTHTYVGGGTATVTVTGGTNTLTGGGGAETFILSGGTNTLQSFGATDTLTVNGGTNTVSQAGGGTLNVSTSVTLSNTGSVTFAGGTISGTVNVSMAGGGGTVSFANNTFTSSGNVQFTGATSAANTVTLAAGNGHVITGGTQIDTFTLTSAAAGSANTFNMLGGNDVMNITATNAAVIVNGDDGNDTFNVTTTTAAIALTGGTGSDTFNIDGGTGTVTITDLATGDRLDVAGGVVVADVAVGFDAVNADVATAATTTLRLAQGASVDLSLDTGSSYTVIQGTGTGGNTIIGSGGADVINVSARGGSNTIVGGAGADNITLGAGRDIVVFDRFGATADVDTISGFTVGSAATADVIRLDISDLALVTADYNPGSVTVVTVAQAGALLAGGLNNHIIVDTEAAILAFDINGGGVARATGPVVAFATDTGLLLRDQNGAFADAITGNFVVASFVANMTPVAANFELIA
jgi:hypothetical protein